MTKPNRTLALALFASGLALVALLFGSAVLAGVLKPLAMGLWALVRIFVLSVDQIKLWTFLTIFLLLFFAYRAVSALMDSSPAEPTEYAAPDQSTTLADMEYWRYMFAETPRDSREFGLVQRELAKLLLSAHATKERVVNDFTLYNDFKSRRIPLPESVYALIFQEGQIRAKTRFRAWLHRLSGRDRVEYRRAIERFLKYLESHMEIHDDE
jgi:hypothetical protein